MLRKKSGKLKTLAILAIYSQSSLVAVANAVELPAVPASVLKVGQDGAYQKAKASTAPDTLPAPAAAAGRAARLDIAVRPGVTEIVDIAVTHLNRIVTPWPSPKVLTASGAETRVDGNAVYVGTTKMDPIGIYIVDPQTNQSISLTLIPRRIPQREIRLVLDSGGVSAFSPSGEKPQGGGGHALAQTPYVQYLRSVLRDIALGNVPTGYELHQRPPKDWRPVCRPPVKGLEYRFDRGQHLKGRDYEVAIGVVINRATESIELDETWCATGAIAAVAYFPNLILDPGAASEVYVVRRILPPPPKPKRKALVSLEGASP